MDTRKTSKSTCSDSSSRKVRDTGFDRPMEPAGSVVIRTKTDLRKLIEKVNSRYFMVLKDKNIYVVYESIDEITGRKIYAFLTPPAFHKYLANWHAKLEGWAKDHLGRGNKDSVLVSKLWQGNPQRRTYRGMIFSPAEEVPEGYFNLWCGFPQLTKPPSALCHPQIFLDHVAEVICDGSSDFYEYVVCWMADAVQNLDATKRPGVALVLRGERGVGKGVFANQFGQIFGRHFFHITSPQHLLGHFNRHLWDCLVLFADELHWGKSEQEKGAGILQGLITEPTISIEIKGQDVFQARNHVRIIMASNQDWVVPGGAKERRYAVIDVSNRRQGDHAYFRRYMEYMEGGGNEDVLHYLQNCECPDVSFLRKIPKTRALTEQVTSNFSDIERYWYDLLQSGSYPGGVTLNPNPVPWGEKSMRKDVVYQDFINNMKGRPAPDVTTFWTRIRKLCPALNEHQQTIGGKRVRVFDVPELHEARSLFNKAFDQEFEWED